GLRKGTSAPGRSAPIPPLPDTTPFLPELPEKSLCHGPGQHPGKNAGEHPLSVGPYAVYLLGPCPTDHPGQRTGTVPELCSAVQLNECDLSHPVQRRGGARTA